LSRRFLGSRRCTSPSRFRRALRFWRPRSPAGRVCPVLTRSSCSCPAAEPSGSSPSPPVVLSAVAGCLQVARVIPDLRVLYPVMLEFGTTFDKVLCGLKLADETPRFRRHLQGLGELLDEARVAGVDQVAKFHILETFVDVALLSAEEGLQVVPELEVLAGLQFPPVELVGAQIVLLMLSRKGTPRENRQYRWKFILFGFFMVANTPFPRPTCFRCPLPALGLPSSLDGGATSNSALLIFDY
jgi:hypothetical protein